MKTRKIAGGPCFADRQAEPGSPVTVGLTSSLDEAPRKMAKLFLDLVEHGCIVRLIGIFRVEPGAEVTAGAQQCSAIIAVRTRSGRGWLLFEGSPRGGVQCSTEQLPSRIRGGRLQSRGPGRAGNKGSGLLF
jgi:hypothetical protein